MSEPNEHSRTRAITLRVNGTEYRGQVEPRKLLVDFLREDLGLTGSHVGCEHGICGACTILVNGEAARSCLMLAVQADGAELMTVEGLAPQAGEPPALPRKDRPTPSPASRLLGTPRPPVRVLYAGDAHDRV